MSRSQVRILARSQKSLAYARLFCDRARIRTWDLLIRSELLYPAELRNLVLFFVGVAGFEPAASCSQSRRDNRATLHPENKKSGETGTRTLATVTRRQISNLLRYHSGTSPFIL